MNVQHYTLGAEIPCVHVAYFSTLHLGEGPKDFTGPFTVHGNNTPIKFSIFHGRKDPEEDMEDWGFEGPTFDCLSVAYDGDRILLQDVSPQSLELASRMGLVTQHDTITLLREEDLVVVPHFMGEKAYFGDLSIALR